MPRARGRALTGLCRALADRVVVLDRGDDRDAVRARPPRPAGHRPLDGRLHRDARPRAPDVFLATDLGTRDALKKLDAPAAPRQPGLAALAFLRTDLSLALSLRNPRKEN